MALPPALQSLFDRVGGPRRAAVLLVGLVTAGLVFGISQWATRPAWVPVFRNLPIESVGVLQDKLNEAGIQNSTEAGGTTLLVKEADYATARVTIARDGGMPEAGRPGLELFDQPSWGMTDFTQRINYRRALEGELERTIGRMRGIELAQVHIAMQEGSVFRAPDKPLEASVVLKLKSGDTPPSDVVRGIAHLVASSVDGLQSDHVTIVDDAGRMLTLDGEVGSVAGLTSRQLAMQREIESDLEKKAQAIVGEIVGAKNARVQVSATLNFDQIERTTQAVDPERQAIATEQKAEVTPGAQGGAASTTASTSYETTKSTETFSGAIGGVKRLTVAVLVNDRIVPGPKPTTVPRDSVEMARIETLVRTAVGLDSARGDKLSVVNAAFDGTVPPAARMEEKPDVWSRIGDAQRPLVTALALVAVLVVAVLTLRALRPSKAAAAALAAAEAHPTLGAGQASAAGAHAPALEAAPAHAAPGLESGEHKQILIAGPVTPAEPVVLREIANPVRDQVVAIIDQRPEAATRIVRAWLKQD